MKRLAFYVGWVACVVLACMLAASSARAQTASSGSITGLVTDPQGAAVPGADVTLTDTATNSKQTSATNDAGRYNFPVVNPGLYDIVVSKTGFKTSKMAQQKISIGLVLTVNVTLEVGSLSETVIVTSTPLGSELQTANATIGNTIDLKQLELLPNLGRDATSLLSLQPGVTPRGDIGGSYMDQNTFTVDGGNNTDDMAGNTIGYIQNFTGLAGAQTSAMASGVVATPIETVEEFKVNTFGQTNDFNQSSGAQVQMVTRRGTDQWHGSGYGYYYATNHGAANSWVNNHSVFTKGVAPTGNLCSAGTTLSSGDNNCVLQYTPIIPNHRSRFGFTVGGPIIPKKILGGKTYLFFGYEGFRFPGTGIFERAYPTAAMRAGVIQIPVADPADPTGKSTAYIPYNLNPFPVTVTVGNSAVSGFTNSGTRLCTLAAYGSVCGGAAGTTLDPRNIGISGTIKNLWTNFLPLPNDPGPNAGDQFNTQGYVGTIRLPLTSNNYVWRMDHDFNSKNRFFGSFRAFKLLNIPNVQVDVGGLVAGKLGQYASSATRPQLGELMVLGLTSNLSSRLTNDLRLSYLWNWWQWGTANDPPQLPGLGGALEITPAGTSGNGFESTAALIPYNVNNQSTRQRVWDGQDKMLRDDMTWVKGNHLIQFGGQVQNNFNYHTRTDNGSTINNQVVYGISFNNTSFVGCGSATATCIPTAVSAAGQSSLYQNLAASVMGLVGQTQVIYTRTGSTLQIQPVGTLAQELSTIKYYSFYGADTWRLKPSLTLSYGLSYMYETPPVEKNGAQVELVDSSGALVHTDAFLAARKAAALAGTGCPAGSLTCAIAPTLGFETTGNLHINYPYTPFKKGFSPRVSLAWSPNYKSGPLGMLFGEGKTVLRGGFGRTWGRINGVNQVLVPLLGPGLLQPVTCSFALSNGTCGTSVNLSNVFRVGPDGLVAPLPAPSQTLPQPFFPGVGGQAVAGDSTVLDPDYKPERVDTWDFTIQRQINRKLSFEMGYMGKRSTNIFEEINLDAVPYMMTLNGQTFANAFANVWTALCAPGGGGRCAGVDITQSNGTAAQKAAALSALIATVPNQAFFEAAFGGTGSSFCGALSCTQALLRSTSVINSTGSTNLFGQTRVSDLWAFMNGRSSWALGKTMLSSQATAINTTTSLGYSNYNAAFFTLKMNDWHGLTSISNFTWGKALGTAQIGQYNSSNQWLDIWNPKASYGPQVFDIKYIFTSGWSYRPTFFKGEHGWKGKLLDGWSVSPFFTAQSGFPIGIGYSESACSACQGFGEMGNTSSGGSAFESALPITPGFPGQPGVHVGVAGSTAFLPGNATSVGTNNSSQVNLFADPAAVWANFRRCVLGIDTSCGSVGNIRGLNRWNMDATLAKDIKFTERVGATFTMQFTNVFNHNQYSDPSSLSLTSNTTFGRITSSVYAARQMEIGLRIHF
ncbi:MAG TPA: carboxypeptidase-like regulatory domain-containing protein [Pyrinomonadaceae bacterium]|nr:carboxypeptidase-like regulatory domain-containing protein [Pyrinomonadaceae bacterium]